MLSIGGHAARIEIDSNLLLLSLFVAMSAHAQQDIPLTLAAAENLAIEQEPGTEAMLAQADAFDHESVAAGQLPELKLRMGIANFPIESGGFATEGMTQAQLGLRMEFPPGSGRIAEYPEIDRAEFFTLKVAKTKINKGQIPLLEHLAARLRI